MSSNTFEHQDPRQRACLINYSEPTSETFGDLKNSALKAGYPEITARQLTSQKPKWLTDFYERQVDLIKSAEDNLSYYVKLAKTKLETKNQIEKAKIQIDSSKFILKTLARKKYSEQFKDDMPNININLNYGARQIDEPVKDAEII